MPSRYQQMNKTARRRLRIEEIAFDQLPHRSHHRQHHVERLSRSWAKRQAESRNRLLQSGKRHNRNKYRHCLRCDLLRFCVCPLARHDRLLKSISLLCLYVERGAAKTTSGGDFFEGRRPKTKVRADARTEKQEKMRPAKTGRLLD